MSPVRTPPTRAEEEAEAAKSFDGFELAVAVVLGLAAMGGAWGGYQSGLWGGNSSTAYGEAATIATKASNAVNMGMTLANRDSGLDLQAKQLIVEGMTTEDEIVKLRQMTVAKYLYTRQMSEKGYLAIGLPKEFRTEDDDKASSLPDEKLVESLDKRLGEAFFAEAVAPGEELFKEADERFAQGREANDVGDKFDLAVVIFTSALFFGGIGLVFKSRMRWGFFAVGVVMLVAAAGYMSRLPLAG